MHAEYLLSEGILTFGSELVVRASSRQSQLFFLPLMLMPYGLFVQDSSAHILMNFVDIVHL